MKDLQIDIKLKSNNNEHKRQFTKKLKNFTNKDMDKLLGLIHIYLDQKELKKN